MLNLTIIKLCQTERSLNIHPFADAKGIRVGGVKVPKPKGISIPKPRVPIIVPIVAPIPIVRPYGRNDYNRRSKKLFLNFISKLRDYVNK